MGGAAIAVLSVLSDGTVGKVSCMVGLQLPPLPEPAAMENNVEEVFITTGNHVAATDYEISYAADAFVLVVNRSRDDFFKVCPGPPGPSRTPVSDGGGHADPWLGMVRSA